MSPCVGNENPVPTQRDTGRKGSAPQVPQSCLSLFLDTIKEILLDPNKAGPSLLPRICTHWSFWSAWHRSGVSEVTPLHGKWLLTFSLWTRWMELSYGNGGVHRALSSLVSGANPLASFLGHRWFWSSKVTNEDGKSISAHRSLRTQSHGPGVTGLMHSLYRNPERYHMFSCSLFKD